MASEGERWLRFSPDYECWPLWDARGDNVDPAGLPIPVNLIADLNDWAERFDAGLNWDDPAATVIGPEEEAAFRAEGRRLAERLRQALPSWTVVEKIRP